jgi:hypothetical protein
MNANMLYRVKASESILLLSLSLFFLAASRLLSDNSLNFSETSWSFSIIALDIYTYVSIQQPFLFLRSEREREREREFLTGIYLTYLTREIELKMIETRMTKFLERKKSAGATAAAHTVQNPKLWIVAWYISDTETLLETLANRRGYEKIKLLNILGHAKRTQTSAVHRIVYIVLYTSREYDIVHLTESINSNEIARWKGFFAFAQLFRTFIFSFCFLHIILFIFVRS